jgi:hypothetical protein
MILSMPFHGYTSDIHNMSLPEAPFQGDILNMSFLTMNGINVNENR